MRTSLIVLAVLAASPAMAANFPLGSLPDGLTTSSQTLAGGDLDLYTFTLSADSDVRFETVNPEDIDTEIGVYDASGTRVANDDDGAATGLLSLLNLTLPAGNYTLVVGQFNTNFPADLASVNTSATTGGDYNLEIEVSPPPPPPPPPTPDFDVGALTEGATEVLGTFAANEFHLIAFNLPTAVTGGGILHLETLDAGGNSFDTEIGLYTASGIRINNNDDINFPANAFSRLRFGALAAGDYFVVVGGFNTNFPADLASVTGGSANGDYRLRLVHFSDEQVPCASDVCVGTNGVAGIVNDLAGSAMIGPASPDPRKRTSNVRNKLREVANAATAAGCDVTGYTAGLYDNSALVQSFDGMWADFDGDRGDAFGVCSLNPRGFFGDFDGDESGLIGDDFASFNGNFQVASSRTDANGFLGGAWIRIQGHRGIFVELHGTCPGDSASALDPWFIGSL